MKTKVKDGWHFSNVLSCEFNVKDGIIKVATNLSHSRTKYAYDEKGHRVDKIPYISRYEYNWR